MREYMTKPMQAPVVFTANNVLLWCARVGYIVSIFRWFGVRAHLLSSCLQVWWRMLIKLVNVRIMSTGLFTLLSWTELREGLRLWASFISPHRWSNDLHRIFLALVDLLRLRKISVVFETVGIENDLKVEFTSLVWFCQTLERLSCCVWFIGLVCMQSETVGAK